MFNPRVLMFGWEYAPYFSGGLGVVTKSIIENLKMNGVKVVFVLPRVPTLLNETIQNIIDASKIHLETNDAQILSEIFVNSLLQNPYISPEKYLDEVFNNIHVCEANEDNLNTNLIYGNNLLKEVEKYASSASEIARTNPHDIIHTHDWMTAEAGQAAKNISGKPHIMHVHATELERSGGNPNQTVFDIEKNGMENADKIIAVSNLTKQKIVENYGISEDKIIVVHNAIDKYPGAKRLGSKINSTDKLVLFLGRLTTQKGANYLLEAAEKVLQNKKRVKFAFIGHGEMLSELIHKSIELGIEKKVMFTGFMNHEDVDRAYQMADLYVMPSVSEPFGITTLEAIKNGTPVIVSKQSGVSEVIKNVLKVDFWDTDELANQILAVIRYNPLAKFLSKNAEKELKKINWNTQSNKIIKVYKNL